MSKAENIEMAHVQKILREIHKEQNDNVIIGYVDYDQLAIRLVRKGIGSENRFEIDTGLLMESEITGFDELTVEPINYKENDDER